MAKPDSVDHQPALPSKFEEVRVLRDDETGVVIPITVRRHHGRPDDETIGGISFAVQREFERNGRTERTGWLAKRHVAAAKRLLDGLLDTLDTEEDKHRAAARAVRRENGR